MASSLNAAVLAIQGEIGTLQKNALNPHFKSKYLSLDALVEHVQPLLTKHGLIWTTSPSFARGDGQDSIPLLRYALIHADSGEKIEEAMPLLLEKQNAQGLGSALTYARRYALCAVLNIVADVDDDGEKAAKRKPVPVETVPEDFASQMRATKMKANDIRMWLQTEGGIDGEDDVAQMNHELPVFLNEIPVADQKKLLAWANGS